MAAPAVRFRLFRPRRIRAAPFHRRVLSVRWLEESVAVFEGSSVRGPARFVNRLIDGGGWIALLLGAGTRQGAAGIG